VRRIFFRSRPPWEPRPGTLRLTWGPRLAAFSWVTIAVAFLIWQIATQDVLFPFNPDIFKWYVLENWATGIAIFFSFFAIVAGIRVWRQEQVRRITMIKFSLVGLVCLFACWFAVHWNLIGPAHRI
jgi:hypothetical protein